MGHRVKKELSYRCSLCHIVLATLVSCVVQKSFYCFAQREVPHLLKVEKERYVLEWTPPELPIIGYRDIVVACDRLLAAKPAPLPDERRHLLFCRGVAHWCRGE